MTNEEKERANLPLKNWFAPMVEPEKVEMLVSLPTLTLGNEMQGSASFRVLEKKIQMTQLCEKSLIPTSRDSRKLLQNSTGRGRRMRTIIETFYGSSYCGIHDGYAIEVAIAPICKPEDTSYVVISRETERFVNEIHDHKEEVGSSSELLEDLQESER